MPPWLDRLLVFALIGGALAYLWWSARRRSKTAAGRPGGPPCAGGCCTPKLPPHLKPRR